MLKAFDEQAVEDKELWEEYSEWSDQTEAEKNEFIQEQKALVMSTEATLASNRQMVAKLTDDLAQLAKDIKETQDSLAELIAMRNEEHQQFEVSLADVTKTIRAVTKATEILEGHYAAGGAALAQIRQRVQIALTMYGQPLKSASPQNMAALASFLQSGSAGPDFLKVDGSKYDNYEKQGGAKGIIGMLEDLRSELESQKQDLIAKENENRQQFEQTKAAKEADLAHMFKVQEQKTEEKKACEATIEECLVTIDEAKKEIADAKAYLEQLLLDRKKFEKEYKERVATRNQEQAATQAALDALQSVSAGAKSTVEGFLQVSMRVGRVKRVMRGLVKVGKEMQSPALIQMASKLRQDYMDEDQQTFFKNEKFNPVLKLLKDLIFRLEEEQNAETSQHEWCDKEKETSVSAKTERETSIHELKSHIEEKSTTVDELKAKILFLEKEIRRVKKETEDAKKQRKKENKLFLESKADHEEVISAIKLALEALGGQYGFLQVSAKVRREASSAAQAPGQDNVFQDYSSGEAGAASAMEMLNDLLERYSKALAELIADEEAAQKAHEDLLARNAQFIEESQNTVNAKLAERRGLLGELADHKVEIKTNMIELHEVNKYLMDLRPACDDIRSTYEERKKRREAEIAALKEALEVISDPTSQ